MATTLDDLGEIWEDKGEGSRRKKTETLIPERGTRAEKGIQDERLAPVGDRCSSSDDPQQHQHPKYERDTMHGHVAVGGATSPPWLPLTLSSLSPLGHSLRLLLLVPLR